MVIGDKASKIRTLQIFPSLDGFDDGAADTAIGVIMMEPRKVNPLQNSKRKHM